MSTDHDAQLVGTWKLKSYIIEDKKTGEHHQVLGPDPNGCLIFTPDGRLMVLITEGGREPVRTDAERSALFKVMIAYSGKYRVEGERFITRVDISWNKWWTSTEHVRTFKITGDRLDIVTAWEPVRPVLGSPLVRGIQSWERET